MNTAVMPNSGAANDLAIGTSDRPDGLPDNWRHVQLRSACKKTSIWNPVHQRRDCFRYIDVSSVSNEHFCVTGTQAIAGASAPSRARKVVKAGDVIYATVRPSLKRVAWIEPRYDTQIASTAFCIVRADPKQAVSKFLYYVLLSENVNRKIIENERGASYPAVTDKDVLNQFVPLPPIDEQEKIAAVLWKIQKAVEIEDAIVRNARDLKKSLLRRLFSHGLHGEPLKETEIGPLPQSWELKECESVCDMITVGIVVQPASHYVPTGVPAFRSLNIREDRLDTSSLVYVSTKANDTILSKSKLRTGDVLVVRTGYPGTSCVVPDQFDGANCIDLVILRPARTMVAEFLSRFFNSESGRQQALNAKTGLAQQHLNIGAVKRMKVPFPSLDEQREIANILQTVDRKIDIHESKKRSLQDLFKTTLHKLMTAQIRVNDLDVDTSELSR